MDNFSKAYELILELEETSYTNNPKDLGGATFCGITQNLYDTYCRYKDLKFKRVGLLSPSEVQLVYHDTFWNLPQNNAGVPISTLLPTPADVVFFQLAVNVGAKQGVKLLQASIGTEPDGSFGPVSASHLTGVSGKTISEALLIAQLAHYADVCSDWDRVGLFNRIGKVRAWMASNSIPALS